jgi:tyrosyl-tRNA synthetase
LIGDFTARIGDPSGRSKTRPPLTEAEIANNVRYYQQQAYKVLDPSLTEVRFNSEWFMRWTAVDMIQLTARYTLARLLERDDFEKRYQAGDPIAMHEMIYPLLQGWDSVELACDVELGGSDQKFNLLVGRQFQKEQSQESQVVITMPLLEGTDGVQKMSKSYGNSIGIEDAPGDMFGKIMSLSDEMMWRYYTLLSFRSNEEIVQIKRECEQGVRHPKASKMDLAEEIVSRFHGEEGGQQARLEFDRVFSMKNKPSDIQEVCIPPSRLPLLLVDIVVECGLTASKGEARRLISQGGLRCNDIRVEDVMYVLDSKGEYVIQAGKRRFVKVVIG